MCLISQVLELWEDGASADVVGHAGCFRASAFNEFSTLDVPAPARRGAAPPGEAAAAYVMRAWLRRGVYGGADADVRGSETLAPFRCPARADYDAVVTERFAWAAALPPLPPLASDRDAPPASSTQLAAPRPLARGGVPASLSFVVNGAARTLRWTLGARAARDGAGGRAAAPSALQPAVAAFCRAHALKPSLCAAVAAHAARAGAFRAAAAALALPAPQRAPSPRRPFVFLHLEKCAGTTLRQHLVDAAIALEARDGGGPAPRSAGPTFYVPCWDADGSGPHLDRRCLAFDASAVPRDRRARLAVLAGHFQWGVWRALPGWAEPAAARRAVADGGGGDAAAARDDDDDDARGVGCFVMLREPIERAISLYYERAYPHTERRINELPLDEWARLVAEFRGSAWATFRDEGLGDAACKMLCGAERDKGRCALARDADGACGGAETAAAARAETDGGERAATAKLTVARDRAAPTPPQPPYDIATATRRLGRCVVGLSDEWDATRRVLAHWFPWIGAFADDHRGNTGFKRGEVETRHTLSPAHAAVLADANACDLALYATGRELFRRQLLAIEDRGEFRAKLFEPLPH